MFVNMKIILFLAIILTAASALELSSEKELLVNLLEGKIRAAQCTSKCAGLPDDVTTEKCMTMCEGAESLCRYAWLCGAACLQACDQTKPSKGDLELSLQQTGCQLSWTTQKMTDFRPVYVVVGTDWTGMWSVFQPGTLSSSMELTDKIMSKYYEVDVLAVTPVGLLAVESIEIRPDHCERDTADNSDQKSSSEYFIALKDILFFASSMACFIFTLAALVLFLCYRKKKIEAQPEQVERAALKPIIKENAVLPPIFTEKMPSVLYDAVYPQINLEESQGFLAISEL